MVDGAFTVQPGHALGNFYLGASIHQVLTLIKADKVTYPAIELHYDPVAPVIKPVIVKLPNYSIRLRFDGADQRLRLIEVVDFRNVKLLLKGSELSKSQDNGFASSRPSFRRIYQILGGSFPGEYIAPKSGKSQDSGIYSVSWPGIAINFPLLHAAYLKPKDKDHVKLLGNSPDPALNLAIFDGNSWPEARGDIFVRIPTGPRLPSIALHPKDNFASELEYATIQPGSRLEIQRRHPAQPFVVILNQTTPQDLISELGPPDATHKRDPGTTAPDHRRASSVHHRPNGGAGLGSAPSSYNSTGTDTFDADFDSDDQEDDAARRAERETFWCYFSHGMDILVGPSTKGHSQNLVVTKVVLHGNVPGSYAFNRHRRLRWVLDLGPKHASSEALSSESNFEEIKPALISAYRNVFPESEMNRGKVVNRTWGAAGGNSSDSSFFLLNEGEGSGKEVVESGGSEAWLGNTRLYTFPGLVMEVVESGAVSALTVY